AFNSPDNSRSSQRPLGFRLALAALGALAQVLELIALFAAADLLQLLAVDAHRHVRKELVPRRSDGFVADIAALVGPFVELFDRAFDLAGLGRFTLGDAQRE